MPPPADRLRFRVTIELVRSRNVCISEAESVYRPLSRLRPAGFGQSPNGPAPGKTSLGQLSQLCSNSQDSVRFPAWFPVHAQGCQGNLPWFVDCNRLPYLIGQQGRWPGIEFGALTHPALASAAETTGRPGHACCPPGPPPPDPELRNTYACRLRPNPAEARSFQGTPPRIHPRPDG